MTFLSWAAHGRSLGVVCRFLPGMTTFPEMLSLLGSKQYLSLQAGARSRKRREHHRPSSAGLAQVATCVCHHLEYIQRKQVYPIEPAQLFLFIVRLHRLIANALRPSASEMCSLVHKFPCLCSYNESHRFVLEWLFVSSACFFTALIAPLWWLCLRLPLHSLINGLS